MRSSNPALSEKTFDNFARSGYFDQAVASRMTVEGTVNKTGILLLLAVISAAFTWHQVLAPGGEGAAMALALGGALGGFIVAMVTVFKPTVSPYTAPVYALLQGLVLGAFSSILNQAYPGIVTQAVGLTFGVMAVMLIAYRTRLIQATEKFKIGVVAATGGIALFYLVLLVGRLFGANFGFFMWNPTPLSIGISLVVVVVAALNLILDFDLIEQGARRGAPKFMEWYGAFSLMVTLIWLYFEILRLLSKLNRR
jgi:uncharacterized YccA/Bax inhibitor family protein